MGALPLEMVKNMAQLVDIPGSAMWNGSAKKGGQLKKKIFQPHDSNLSWEVGRISWIWP